MDIYEGAVLRGAAAREALPRGPGIITRVCAICSANHTVAALTALEKALGVEPPDRIHRLRGLLLLGATIESHALHVFALALPDFLGYDSVISMAAKFPARSRSRSSSSSSEPHPGADRRRASIPSTRSWRIRQAPEPRGPEKGPRGARGDARPSHEVRGPRADARGSRVGLAADRVPRAPALRPLVLPLPRRVDLHVEGEEYPLEQYRTSFESSRSSTRTRSIRARLGRDLHGWLARSPQAVGRPARRRAREAFETLFLGRDDNVLTNNWPSSWSSSTASSEGSKCATPARHARGEERARGVRGPRRQGVGAIECRGDALPRVRDRRRRRVVSANVITPTAQNATSRTPSATSGRRSSRSWNRGPAGRLRAPQDELEMVARAYDPCISCSVHVVVE